MRISPQGLHLIESFEGFSATPYNDGTGVMTIGFGTTEADVKPLPRHLTRAQAEKLLAKKLAEKYEPAIRSLGVPLNQNQFDALVSLAYNCGPGIVNWQIGKDLRAHHFNAAADDFLRYVHAGGVVLQGLVNRRRAERHLFLSPVAHPHHAPPPVNMRSFRTIQGCPVYADIAPYIAIVVNDAKATVNSIYRGDEAAGILHRHGKHTQRELYQAFLAGHGAPANAPGHSSHELRSDGVAYPGVPYGHKLPWWCQGFDVNDGDVQRVKDAAARRGWHLFQPYPSSVEFHHLNFRGQPKPTPRTITRIWRIRATYPRR